MPKNSWKRIFCLVERGFFCEHRPIARIMKKEGKIKGKCYTLAHDVEVDVGIYDDEDIW